MTLAINTMKSMLQYAVYTLHTATGSRKSMLRGITESDGIYRVHMLSLSPYFFYDEAVEINGRTVEIEGDNYMITIGSDLWFNLEKVSS